MLGLPTIATANSLGMALGAIPPGWGSSAVPSESGLAFWRPGNVNAPGNFNAPGFRTPVVPIPQTAFVPANRAGGVPGVVMRWWTQEDVPAFADSQMFHDWAAAKNSGLERGGQLWEEWLRDPVAQGSGRSLAGPPSPATGGVRPAIPAPKSAFSLRTMGRGAFALDLLSQSGHGPMPVQRNPQEVAVLAVFPGPRGTFYWNPPTSDSSGFWNNFGSWSVGQPDSNIINGELVYTNRNLGHLIPGPGDPVVFDGVLQNSTRRLCVFVDPPASGSMCSSMLFANGWNGTLQLTGTVQPGAPGTAIANLSVDTGSNPTITCDLGDLRLAGTCSIPKGAFTVSGASLVIASDASVTVGSITVSAASLLLNQAGRSTLFVTGGGISAPQAPIILTSSGASLVIQSNATIDGWLINQGGTVQIGTPSGAGDDQTQYTLTVKSYPDSTSVSYHGNSGSLKIYNGGQLSLAGGFRLAGGTVATGFSAVGKTQSFITAGLGKTGLGISAGLDFTGGTVSPGSLGANPYCNLRLFLGGTGRANISGATVLLPINGQTPGTGASISSNSQIAIAFLSSTLQVVDGSGSGVLTGSWTLIPGNAPTRAVTGDFTTLTLPTLTQETAGLVGVNYVFQDFGSSVATTCSTFSTISVLSAVVTNSNTCDGLYTLSYDGSTYWKDGLIVFGNRSVTPGSAILFYCSTGWKLAFNATIYTPTAPPAGHGNVIFNNVDMTFFGGSATSTVTIQV